MVPTQFGCPRPWDAGRCPLWAAVRNGLNGSAAECPPCPP